MAAAVAGTSMVELERLDAARKAGLVELQRYLDENGGVASAKHAGVAFLSNHVSECNPPRRGNRLHRPDSCEAFLCIQGGTGFSDPAHKRDMSFSCETH